MYDKSTLTVRTPDGVEWKYAQPKSGGVNQAGPLGGIYHNLYSKAKKTLDHEIN